MSNKTLYAQLAEERINLETVALLCNTTADNNGFTNALRNIPAITEPWVFGDVQKVYLDYMLAINERNRSTPTPTRSLDKVYEVKVIRTEWKHVFIKVEAENIEQAKSYALSQALTAPQTWQMDDYQDKAEVDQEVEWAEEAAIAQAKVDNGLVDEQNDDHLRGADRFPN